MVICVSSYIRSHVLDDGRRPRIRFSRYAMGSDPREIDAYESRSYPGRFRELDAAFPPGPPTVLTVSRLMDRKGIDRVIEAMPAIVRSVPGTRYVVVGDGGDRGTRGEPCLQIARSKLYHLPWPSHGGQEVRVLQQMRCLCLACS